eukprot:7679531-Pyramimonas_sp.AAC.1
MLTAQVQKAEAEKSRLQRQHQDGTGCPQVGPNLAGVGGERSNSTPGLVGHRGIGKSSWKLG